MMTDKDFWKMFEMTGKIEFYNAYRALGGGENGQKAQSDSDKGGAVSGE